MLFLRSSSTMERAVDARNRSAVFRLSAVRPGRSGDHRKFADGTLIYMQGWFESRHLRLTTVGIVLCLLAALFAVEAKIAWFSPAGSGCAQMSAAKARPAEQPKLLPVRLTWPDAAPQDFAFYPAIFINLFLLCALAAVVLAGRPEAPAADASPAFAAALFFRPPPSL